ncbi:hypothetical protein QWJ90_00150 [Microbacterium oryzae]|uniref:hypothetical protein n=1 Tax=Microbacterium oryzae TaxID=743009 RepID=UPI0025AFD9E4|nr:hypothetical protein [Microbacterium oryzae]MDN3309338.1 hypothetical protein [Microbacterium oryzae]
MKLIDKTARCYANEEHRRSGRRLPPWGDRSEEQQKVLIEEITRVFQAIDEAQRTVAVSEPAKADPLAFPASEDDQFPYDGEGSWPYGLESGRYDDDLDALLTSRGWTSDRSWKEDVVVDQWLLTFGPDHYGRTKETVITCNDRNADLFTVQLAGVVSFGTDMTRDELLGTLDALEAHRP